MTFEQAKALCDGGNVEENKMSHGDTCWIIEADDKGWLLVGNGSVPADEEGNGVWLDPEGKWQYGDYIVVDPNTTEVVGFGHGTI